MDTCTSMSTDMGMDAGIAMRVDMWYTDLCIHTCIHICIDACTMAFDQDTMQHLVPPHGLNEYNSTRTDTRVMTKCS